MKRSLASKARASRAALPVRLEALESRCLLASFSVTNVTDSGPGSFRQALLDNDVTPGTNTISFAIPGAGVHTIAPASPLPEINNPAVVDATTQPGYAGIPLIELDGANVFQPNVTPPTPMPDVNALVLSGGSTAVKGFAIDRFTGSAIVTTRDNNTIAANFLGTDPTGTSSLGNGGNGIAVFSRGNTIGGAVASSRNLISGNTGFGVLVSTTGGQSSNNSIQGNFIGTDVTGTLNLGNARAGVLVTSSSGNTIGGETPSKGNVIAFNGGAGVQIGVFSSENIGQDRISENSLFGNAGLGIDLGGDGVTFNQPGGRNFGPNLLQNDPVLTSAYGAGGRTTIEGILNAAPNASFTIEFYSSPQADPTGFGEGKTFLGSSVVTTDATGNADLTSTLPVVVAPGQFLSATATDSVGNTSEFARSIAATATAQSDLLAQSLDPSPTPQAGIARSYTFRVTNQGPSRASNVVAIDTLPAGATFLTGSSTQGTVNASNGTVTIRLGTLASGASAQFTLRYSVPTPGPATNTVSVQADQLDPIPSDDTLTQDFLVGAAPAVDLSLSGSSSPFSVRVGDSLTYTFVVSNLDPSNPSSSVVLTDTLPQGVIPVSARSSQGSTATANGVVTASLGSINAGFNAVVTIVVRATASGPLTNTASVIASEADPNSVNNQAAVTTFVSPAPSTNLALFGTGSPASVLVGDTVTYTFVVRNFEFTNPGTGVVVTDPLPQGVTIVSAQSSQGTTTIASGVVTAGLGTIVAGSNAVVTIVVRPTAPGPLTNTATVQGNETDPDSLNNQSSVTTNVSPAPATDLSVLVTAAPQSPSVGNNYTYAVLVGNAGAATASGVSLVDILPDAAAIVSIKASQGTYTLVGRTLTVALGSLAPGALAEVTISLFPGAPGLLLDQAVVSGDQPDPIVANNYSSLGATVQADVTAPTVTYSKLKIARNAISSVVLTFDKDLDPALASDPANYQILDLGGNGSPSANGPKVAIASATYDPVARSVTLTPARGLSIGRFYKLVVNGPGATGVTDKAGNVLDGAFNGLQNSIFTAIIGRGTRNRPVSVQTGVPSPNASSTRPSSSARTVKVAKATPVHAATVKALKVSVPVKTSAKSKA